MRRQRSLFAVLLVCAPVTLLAQAARRPVFQPTFQSSRDSDGNLGLRLGLATDAWAGPRTQLGVEGSRWQVEDGIDRVRSFDVAGRGTFRPTPSVRIEATAGGSVLDLSGAAVTETVVPTGRARLRWHGARGAAVDLRARRGLLGASPELMANRVLRNEIGGTVDIPLAGRLKVRGGGRFTGLDDRLDNNTRTTATGMLVIAATPTVEISGQVHRIAYDHFSTAGYFAPREVQVAQVGSYGEVERGTVSLAYDVAAGAQRLAEQGGLLGRWGRAVSLWSQLGLAFSPAAALQLELEFSDSPAAAVAAGGAGWKYGSGGVSLRWTL